MVSDDRRQPARGAARHRRGATGVPTAGQSPLRHDSVDGRAEDRAHHGRVCGHQERAFLVAAYTAMVGTIFSPAVDTVVTKGALPCRRNTGSAAAMPCSPPRRLTSIIADHPSTSRSDIGPTLLMAALLTKTSSRPNSST